MRRILEPGLARVALCCALCMGVVVAWQIYGWSARFDDIGEGSDEPPLTGADFAQALAELQFDMCDRASACVEYTIINHTDDDRSFVWSDLSAESDDGRALTCWGDDSNPRYEVRARSRVPGYGSCNVDGVDGVVTFSYDEVVVGYLSI